MGQDSSIQTVHLSAYEPVSQDVLELLPVGLIKKQDMVPIKKENGKLIVAISKLEGVVRPAGLAMIAGCPVDLVLAPLDEIKSFIRAHYPDVVAPASIPAHVETVAQSMNIIVPSGKSTESPALISMNGVPLIALKILNDAALNRAREVHISFQNGTVRVRERIRGSLVNVSQQLSLKSSELVSVFEWIKKVGESRKDEWMEWTDLRKDFDINGEKYHVHFFLSDSPTAKILTISLSQQKEKIFAPDSWGMDPSQVRIFTEYLNRSTGLVLFCGPDFHGIEDNLVASVKMLATPAKHVISVEAKQEVWIPEVEQFVAEGNSDLFSQSLKVAFQHMPDVVIVNPLSKKDDFKLCLTETLRGRFVLARAYAQDTVDALLQLSDMGLEPYLIGSGLVGILTKRTLRLNCSRCQVKDPSARTLAKEVGIPLAMLPANFYKGNGCETCRFTGFDGSTDIFELFTMTDEVRGLLAKEAKPESFRQYFKQSGLLTLRQVALHKAFNGQTSFNEVIHSTPK